MPYSCSRDPSLARHGRLWESLSHNRTVELTHLESLHRDAPLFPDLCLTIVFDNRLLRLTGGMRRQHLPVRTTDSSSFMGRVPPMAFLRMGGRAVLLVGLGVASLQGQTARGHVIVAPLGRPRVGVIAPPPPQPSVTNSGPTVFATFPAIVSPDGRVFVDLGNGYVEVARSCPYAYGYACDSYPAGAETQVLQSYVAPGYVAPGYVAPRYEPPAYAAPAYTGPVYSGGVYRSRSVAAPNPVARSRSAGPPRPRTRR
jgi:hypothetical protein